MPDAIVQPLVQFGVAGLMGVLWVWERLYSRQRERQLDQAHQRLLEQRQHVDALTQLVQQNTIAIERFDRTQMRLIQLLETLHHEMRKTAA